MSALLCIEKHQLQPHPEGGYYVRTYCSDQSFPGKPETDPFPAGRPWSTAILYLMEAGDFSGFHRIKSDELWHFYEGGTIELFLFRNSGQLELIRLGPDQAQQITIPANHWFAAAPASDTEYALVGCTLSPGFLFQDHEMANASELTAQFPDRAELIRRFCRS